MRSDRSSVFLQFHSDSDHVQKRARFLYQSREIRLATIWQTPKSLIINHKDLFLLMLYDHHRSPGVSSLHANTQGHRLIRLMRASHYGVLSVIVVVGSINGLHTLAPQGIHLDVTHVISTHSVPLPVLVPVGFIGQNKSLSHTQLRKIWGL